MKRFFPLIFFFVLFFFVPFHENVDAFCSRVLIFDTWVCGGTCDGGQCGYQANGVCGCIVQPTEKPEPGDKCGAAGGT